jgi:hypothetical protein
MEREVKIKDYQSSTHLLMVALNSVGIHTDYPTTHLIESTINLLNEKGDKASIEDSVKIRTEHKKFWENYFKNKGDGE